MFKKIHKVFMVLGLLSISMASQAALVSIDAQFTFGWNGSRGYTGEIIATDLNSDGFIRKNEVTSIFESYGQHSTISSLYDIGDINISSETWTPNGVSWGGYPDTAFLTFDNRNWSCSTYNDCGVTFTSFDVSGSQNSVPEPASLALMGVGLAGLAFRRRRG